MWTHVIELVQISMSSLGLWGANLRWDGRSSWGVQCPLHPNGQGRSDFTESCGFLTEISLQRSVFKTLLIRSIYDVGSSGVFLRSIRYRDYWACLGSTRWSGEIVFEFLETWLVVNGFLFLRMMIPSYYFQGEGSANKRVHEVYEVLKQLRFLPAVTAVSTKPPI